jgi:Integrase core domain
MNKGEHVASQGLLEPIPILEGAWEVITMDFIGGLPKSEGKDVIMVIIDKLTKYYYLLSLSHPFKAVTVVEAFLETIYKLHGLPQGIITDRDPIFTSHFWKELMGKL